MSLLVVMRYPSITTLVPVAHILPTAPIENQLSLEKRSAESSPKSFTQSPERRRYRIHPAFFRTLHLLTRCIFTPWNHANFTCMQLIWNVRALSLSLSLSLSLRCGVVWVFTEGCGASLSPFSLSGKRWEVSKVQRTLINL